MFLQLQIVAVANLMPVDEAQDELDSYMYQTVSLAFDSVYFCQSSIESGIL